MNIKRFKKNTKLTMQKKRKNSDKKKKTNLVISLVERFLLPKSQKLKPKENENTSFENIHISKMHVSKTNVQKRMF